MRVRVLLFGPLAEIFGVREEWLELDGDPRVSDVYRHYFERNAKIGRLQSSLHIAVNRAIAEETHALSPDDEVALLPPVAGGSDTDGDLIELVETRLEDHPWRSQLASSGTHGALATFEGLVRREEDGDPVVALSFDAYRPMAISTMAALADEARQRWPIERVVMIHRLGLVPAGEVCVVVAVTTGHRAESFAACKFLIDTLKATVPIWKKEITASVARWVEGVPMSAPEAVSLEAK